MEYSVFDLIRILLKKSYIVILIMIVIAGAALFLSERSYRQAVEQYEALTTETVPVIVETGTTSVTYQCGYSVKETAMEVIKIYQENDDAFGGGVGAVDVDTMAAHIFAEIQPQILQILRSDELLPKVQAVADSLSLQEPPTINADKVVTPSAGPLVVANHVKAASLSETSWCMEISGLEKAVADQVADIYAQCLAQSINNPIISITVEKQSDAFTPDPLQPTKDALFMQIVLQEPPASPPNKVKVAGTAAAYAFVLGCFLVLLATFVKESRVCSVKKPEEGQEKA